MKKPILLFVLFSCLIGLNNIFSQNVQPVSSFQKNKEALHSENYQHKNLSGFDKQKIFKTGGKVLLLAPDTVITYSTIDLQARYIFTFDDNGNMLTRLEEKWQSGAWVNYKRYTYTYDGNGNNLIELYEYWESDLLVNSYRYTNTYDGNGNELTQLYEKWESGILVNCFRYTSIYDSNGNMLSYLHEKIENSVWVNLQRYTYIYDENGNRLSYLYEKNESRR